MADEKKKTKAEKKLEQEQAEALGAGRTVEKDRLERESAKDDGKPGFDAAGTPSALALEKVGPDGDGEEYAAEKKRHRWG